MPHTGYHGDPSKNGSGPRRTTRRVVPPRAAEEKTAEPEGVTIPPLPVIEAEHARLAEQNMKDLTRLRAEGVELDPLGLTHARIDHLIDSFAQFAGPDGPRWAAWTRLTFEQRMAENIRQAAPEGRKQNLAQGASWSPGMIRLLARETGTFGGR
jgi:hypothetical protein